MIFLDPNSCKKTIVQTLLELNVADDAARDVAESLVMTSLRGVDSHGIELFPHYVRAVKGGRINPRAQISKIQTGASTMKIDADHAFGHHAGSVAISEAVKMAQVTGIGATSVSNSTHFGSAAYFALQATRHDCLGFAFTNANALVKVPNAKEAFFGANPICFAAPLQNEGPFCLDISTSLVAWNKIMGYRQKGEKIPSDWAFDAEGNPVDDPNLAVTLNPAGSYKGFGLGMMVDILCATLTGGLISKDLLSMYNTPIDERRKISHFFLALNISSFNEPEAFRVSLQLMVDRIRNLEPVNPEVPVMVPGDPEKRMSAIREKTGIPISELKMGDLREVSPLFKELIRK
jgi:ureidoglycolate dehydrogenase (NAD+)